MANRSVNNKKTALLLSRKEKLLEEIQYYEKRIADFHSKLRKDDYFENESSDSEEDFPTINNSPSMVQLKLHQSVLKTSLQATQELTSLLVLQSEVNILTVEPILVDEAPVHGPGIWHEVTAECRVDLVPFSMTFYVHKPLSCLVEATRHHKGCLVTAIPECLNAKFGSYSYRGVRVTPVKSAHEAELSKTILHAACTPSDAVEVLKSYASAHRSRRTTLARLAEKYASTLFMKPMPDGGYLVRCADLLEISWTLQNKWSYIAPFHHRMKFDLEYMDESYIKIISQLYKQLLDPSIGTDERTMLLSKIINTCLKAKTTETNESMESEPEIQARLRTTLDEEREGDSVMTKRRNMDELNRAKERNSEVVTHTNTDIDMSEKERAKERDSEVMAPPKTLPKRIKKGKENVKSSEIDNAKKSKLSDIAKTINNNASDNNNKIEEAKKGKENTKKASVTENNNAKKLKSSEAGKIINDHESDDINKLVEAKTAKDNAKRGATSEKNNAKKIKVSDVGKINNNHGSDDITKLVEAKTAKDNAKRGAVSENNNAKKMKVSDGGKINNNHGSDHITKLVEAKTAKENAKRGAISEKNNVKKMKVSDVGKINNNHGSDDINKLVEAKTTKENIKSAVSGNNNTKKIKVSDVGKTSNNKASGDNNQLAEPKENAKKASVSDNNKKVTDKKDGSDNKTIKRSGSEVNNKNTKKPKTTDLKENIDSNMNKENKINEKTNGETDKLTKTKDDGLKKTSAKPSINNIKVADKKQDGSNIKKNINKKITKDKEIPKETDKNKLKSMKNADMRNEGSKNSDRNNIIVDKNIKSDTNKQKTDKNSGSDNNNRHIKSAGNEKTTNNKFNKVNIKTKTNLQNKNIDKKIDSKMDSDRNKMKVVSNSDINKVKTHKVMPKANVLANNDKKLTKIPQKFSSNANNIKKNPLRISPRKQPSKMSMSSDLKKSIQKSTTNIPRLLKKPLPKT